MRDWVHHFPGASERLYRIVEGSEFAAVTHVALDAVDMLREVWEPLSAEAIVFGLTSTDIIEADLIDVAQPHWLLVRAPVLPGVRIDSLMRDPAIRETPSLARVNIEGWLADALGQASAPAHGEWSELYFRAGRAWAGPPGWRAGEDELRLHHEAGTVLAPIERDPDGAWISGPREPAFDQPPFELRFTHVEGRLTLMVTRHYGNWIDPSPATDRLDERLAALRAANWEAST